LSFLKNHLETGDVKVGRRGFLKLGIMASVAGFSTSPALAAFQRNTSPERSLSFYNTHTRENLTVVYWSRGKYLSRALEEINYIMRDHRSGEIENIDERLLDLLCAIHTRLRGCSPFHIISGYRSPATNALLRRSSKGVAKNSMHLVGMAADIRLPGCDLSSLRGAAVKLKGGGVGYYPHSDFVHVDVGRVRYW